MLWLCRDPASTSQGKTWHLSSGGQSQVHMGQCRQVPRPWTPKSHHVIGISRWEG